MPLNALSLSTTQGVQGRPFRAKINGLTTGKVEVLGDGSPGFSTVNGFAASEGLPYPTSTIVLREYEPGVGQGFRDSRIDIVAATRAQLLASAQAQVGVGRVLKGYRVAGQVQSDGTTAYSIKVEDDLGATVSVDVGIPVPPIASFTQLPSITTANPVAGSPLTVTWAATGATSATAELLNASDEVIASLSGATSPASFTPPSAGQVRARVTLQPGNVAQASAAVTVGGGGGALAFPSARWDVPYSANIATSEANGSSASGLPAGVLAPVSGGSIAATGTPY